MAREIFFVRLGVSPNLCCDPTQLNAISAHRSMLDNIIGRCPSCYYNFLQLLCEMACSPNQDQFIWPLETRNISRVESNNEIESTEAVKEGWEDEDYVEPVDEEAAEDGDKKEVKTAISSPIEKVEVVTRLRYFLSEKQAQDFLASCW